MKIAENENALESLWGNEDPELARRAEMSESPEIQEAMKTLEAALVGAIKARPAVDPPTTSEVAAAAIEAAKSDPKLAAAIALASENAEFDVMAQAILESAAQTRWMTKDGEASSGDFERRLSWVLASLALSGALRVSRSDDGELAWAKASFASA